MKILILPRLVSDEEAQGVADQNDLVVIQADVAAREEKVLMIETQKIHFPQQWLTNQAGKHA